jgi:hypothetical protein
MEVGGMKRSTFIVQILFTACVAIFVAESYSQDSPNSTAESSAIAMDRYPIVVAGVKHQYEGLTVKGEFVFKRGFSKSLEDGLAGVFFDPRSNELTTDEVAHGSFVKLGKSIRYGITFACPSDYDPSAKSSTLMSEDVIIHGEWVLHRIPRQVSKQGVAFGNSMNLQSYGRNVELSELANLSPFAKYSSFLAPMFVSRVTTLGKDYNTKVEMPNEHELIVELYHETGKLVERARFNVDKSSPMLQTSIGNNWHAESQDIVELPSGREFAKTYRFLLGPVRVAEYDHPLWIAHSWSATNVSEDVTRADFKIALAPNESYSGPPLLKNVVDVFELSTDDASADPTIATTNSSTKPSGSIVTVGVVIIAILFLAIVSKLWIAKTASLIFVLLTLGCGTSEVDRELHFSRIAQSEMINGYFEDEENVPETEPIETVEFGAIFPHYDRPEERVLQTGFRLYNNADEVMQLEMLGTTCGCVDAKLSTDELHPKSNAALNVAFYPSLTPVCQSQSISVDLRLPAMRSQKKFRLAVEIYPRLFSPAAAHSIPLLDNAGELQVDIIAHSTIAFKDDLAVHFDTARVDLKWQKVSSDYHESVYRRQWKMHIKKRASFDDGFTTIRCVGNDSKYSLIVRDSFLAYDISHENLYFGRGLLDQVHEVLIVPVNVSSLGEVKFDRKHLTVQRIDNPDGSTLLRVRRNQSSEFLNSIELFSPFAKSAEAKITVSGL